MTASAGSLFFSALFMLLLLPFFLPDFTKVTAQNWLFAITLGVVCTAFAYVIFFRLLTTIGPSRAVSVTFLVPIFSFVWGYLLLDEIVTTRMWGAIVIILFGMSLVLRILKFDKIPKKLV
jgi:drug/metabolite transporter (DMT)-like permease